MMGLYDKNDVLITRLVDSAVASPDVIEIKNRTLDGQWHVQSIGTSATVLTVKAHLKLQGKEVLDNIKRNSDLLKVIFDVYGHSPLHFIYIINLLDINLNNMITIIMIYKHCII